MCTKFSTYSTTNDQDISQSLVIYFIVDTVYMHVCMHVSSFLAKLTATLILRPLLEQTRGSFVVARQHLGDHSNGRKSINNKLPYIHYTHTHSHTRTYTHTSTHKQTNTPTHTHACTDIETHTHIYTSIHKYIQACICTNKHSHKQTRTHTVHAHVHTTHLRTNAQKNTGNFTHKDAYDYSYILQA